MTATRRARLLLALVGFALLGLTLAPLRRPPRADGFPFSTYPMFATHRPRLQTVAHVVGIAPSGAEAALRPALLGTDEVMQAVATVRRAVAAGPAGAERLCARVAAAVARSGAPADAAVARVEVRSDTFDAVAYFAGDRRPRDGRVHAACAVPRTGGAP
jgi:hypothetical protein